MLVGASACGSDGTSPDSVAVGPPPTGPGGTDPTPSGETITLVTYDSFPESDTSLNGALASFTEQTGIDVEILVAGDAGTMLSKASLTAGNPEGDVMWGIDNTLLSRAVTDEIFEPYVAAGIADGSVTIDGDFTSLVPNGEATPVDYGDVCVNYDIGWFAERDLAPPTTLADLADPAYAGMLVVQNPATSSPGLASCWRRSTSTASRVGSATGVRSAPTASRSSTAGPRPTTSGSPGPAVARRRWSSATDRAHPPR